MFRVALLITLLVLGACGDGTASVFDFGVEDAAMSPPWMQPDFAHPDAALPSPLTMVADIDQRATGAGVTDYVDFAGAVWFGATGPKGPALFKSDGTAAGTTIALDLSTDLGNPTPFAVVGTNLVFTRSSVVAGAGLWITNGTLAGSSQIFGQVSSMVGPMGGKLYFTAVSGGSAYLYVTDGTAAGTSPVSTTLTVARASVVGNTIWMSATMGTATGYELYTSDGTSAGAVLVKDINPGAGDSNPAGFALLGNGKVLFCANDGTHGNEPWISDGTTANTSLVLDINAGAARSVQFSFTSRPAVVGGFAYFMANSATYGYEVWRSDGTPGGTTLVKDIVAGTDSSYPVGFVALGNEVVFSATTAASGRELWITDGTAINTTQVKEIDPGATDGVGLLVPAVIGSNVYFVADDGMHGRELWSSDGIAANTAMVDDVFAGPRGGLNNARPIALRNRLWFLADDAMRDLAAYSSDGTASGTNPLPVGATGTTSSAGPHDGARLGDKLLFIANDGLTGNELYVTDGTATGTMRITDLNPGLPDGAFGAITVVGHVAYFRGHDVAHGLELWKTDGTTAGTVLVADLNPGPGDSLDQADLPVVISFGNQLIFRATNGTQGFEPWTTMGTQATTSMLVDLDPGAGDGMDSLLNARVIGNKLYFDGYDSPTSPGTPPISVLDEGLFAYDGSTFTRLTGDDTIASQLTLLGNTLYFTQGSVFFGGGSGFAKTDGTKAGTALVSGISGLFMTVLGSDLVLATSGTIYKSDGTAAGTKFVSMDGPPSSYPVFGLGVSGSSIFYLGGNGTDGRGLWTSDLTTTKLVAELEFVEYPAQTPIFVNQQMYFTAGTADIGLELFVSDGTTAGTHPVADARPGPLSSTPTILSAGAHDLYVSLGDGVHGVELWRLTY